MDRVRRLAITFLILVAAISQIAAPSARAATPSNDSFAAAEELTGSLPISVPGTNVDATKESGEPAHAGNGGGASVWYRWTPSVMADVTIDVCGADFDTLLAVYTGTAVDALTEVAANDDSSCGLASRVMLTVEAGTTYRIAVDGFSGASGTFTLTVAEVDLGPPANDDFADAEMLTGPLPIQTRGDNVNASSEPGEPDHVPGGAHNSVWYRWIADTTGPITIETCPGPTGFFDSLAVYTGTQVDALTRLQADEGQCSPFSRLTLDAVVGTTYNIAVAGSIPGSEGDLTLQIRTGAPANDNLAHAEDVAGAIPITAIGSTVDATSEIDEPGDPVDATIWYGWTPTATQDVTVETCGSSVDTTLLVYTGTTYGTLALVGGNNDACARQSRVTFTASAGSTYRLAVLGLNGEGGDIVLTIGERRPAPANDNFADARLLSGRLPIVVHDTNEGAGAQPGEPDHEGTSGGASVWYRWTSDISGEVVVDTCGSVPSTLLGIYTGNSVGTLTEVEGQRQGCFSQSRMSFTAQAGRVYRIAVDGDSASIGAFVLRLRRHIPPPNDDFTDAIGLRGKLPISAGGTTMDATFEPGEPRDYVAPGLGNSIWYRWTPTVSGPVAIESCGSNEPALVSIWTGGSVDGLTQAPDQRIAACELRPGSTASFTEGAGTSISFPAVAGTTYMIALDGFFAVLNDDNDVAVGEVRLTIRNMFRPPNDNFGHEVALKEKLPSRISGSNVDATREPLEPNHFLRSTFETPNTSIWYRWTSKTAGDVVAETCGSSFDTIIAVYTGETLDELTPADAPQKTIHDDSCGRQSRYPFTATPGTTYRIAVSGPDVQQGVVQLTLRRASPPPNDDLADAMPLRGKVGLRTRGTTIDATREPGEETPGIASVWYRWIPDASEDVMVDACRADFDTRVEVFTGETVANLTDVASNDDRCGRQSKVRFFAQAGTMYLIKVVGNDSNQGPFALEIRRPKPPSNDDFAARHISARRGNDPEHDGRRDEGSTRAESCRRRRRGVGVVPVDAQVVNSSRDRYVRQLVPHSAGGLYRQHHR